MVLWRKSGDQQRGEHGESPKPDRHGAKVEYVERHAEWDITSRGGVTCQSGREQDPDTDDNTIWNPPCETFRSCTHMTANPEHNRDKNQEQDHTKSFNLSEAGVENLVE